MSQTAIFWPMIAHVALVYAVYLLMSRRRVAAVKSGAAKVSQFRENNNEPAESLFARNNLANQFELPMLFYPACLSLFVTGGAGTVAVVFAWIFAIARIAHTVVHVTTNRIRYRRPIWIAGYMAVAALWIWLVLHLLEIV